MTDLDALTALLAAATPGPWSIDEFDLYLTGPDGDPLHWDAEGLGATWANDPDPTLIVAAVNALPSLIEAARRASEGENTDWHYCDCDSPHHAYHEAARREAGLREALTRIKEDEGKVCDEYESCTHAACASSYNAWATADAALHDNAGTGER